jgi:hypothetical protein
MCVSGMEYFTRQKQSVIHFAIGPGFQWKRNRATTMEMQMAKRLWMERPNEYVRFYVSWQPIPSQPSKRFWRFVPDPRECHWFMDDRHYHYYLSIGSEKRHVHLAKDLGGGNISINLPSPFFAARYFNHYNNPYGMDVSHAYDAILKKTRHATSKTMHLFAI